MTWVTLHQISSKWQGQMDILFIKMILMHLIDKDDKLSVNVSEAVENIPNKGKKQSLSVIVCQASIYQ